MFAYVFLIVSDVKYHLVHLGVGKDRTTHLVTKGKDRFKAELKKSFPAPEDQKSIDQFFIDMGVSFLNFEFFRNCVFPISLTSERYAYARSYQLIIKLEK